MSAFEKLADTQMVAAAKAKERAREKRAAKVTMVPTALEKAEREKHQQVRLWRAWQREKEAGLLNGPYSARVRALRDFTRTMTIDSAPELVGLVEKATWLRQADKDVRGEVLSLIGNAIIRLREREGLLPFDDPLDGELNAFLQIRELLR